MKRSKPTRLPYGALCFAALFWVAGRAEPATSEAGTMIGPLLPKALGEKVCYAGTYSKQAIDIEDWSHTKNVPVPGLIQFGEQVMRPEPETLPSQEISSLTLLLDYDDRTAGYDWIYNFTLRAEPAQWSSKLFGAGECPWYAKDRAEWNAETQKANEGYLHCGIDCDGGEMTVERVPGTGDLLLRFDGMSGLRMSAGCGGGGTYRLGTAKKDGDTAFLLNKADTSTCKPLEDWLESQ
jgi:hypothetical protein